MVKHFLKNTDKEVKIGNKIHVEIPMKTPYGEGNCIIETLVTQASLGQLCKDGIVEKREISEPHKAPELNFEDYKPYIRRLSRKMKCSFSSACEFMDILKSVSPHSHICLLIELASELLNAGKELGDYVYIVNLGSGNPIKRLRNVNIDLPKFATYEDAVKTATLIAPFITESRNGK